MPASDPSAYLAYLHNHTALIDDPPEPLENALIHPRLLIVGPSAPAFLRHIAFLWCSGLEDARTYSLIFPILIRLAELSNHLNSPEPLLDCLAAQSRQLNWELSASYFREKLPAAFLLLDGLNEVPETHRHSILRLIEDAATAWPQSRIIVTTRLPFDALFGFHTELV